MRREPFELRNDREQLIRGEVLHPAGEVAGTVLVCHGFKGFYRWGFFPWLAEQLARAGLRTVVFNFSGSGVGPDRESFTDDEAFFHNTYGRELADVATVEQEGVRRGWLSERYGLFGHSRGGGVAVLHAAASGRVGALVTWAAIATVSRWPAAVRREWRERGWLDVPNARTGQVHRIGTALLDEVESRGEAELSVTAAAARVRAPWLIVHGTADETVSADDARTLAAAAEPGGRAELLLIEGAGHTFDVAHGMTEPSPALDRAARRTVEFLRAHSAS